MKSLYEQLIDENKQLKNLILSHIKTDYETYLKSEIVKKEDEQINKKEKP